MIFNEIKGHVNTSLGLVRGDESPASPPVSAPGSCPQRSGGALELSQGLLEALLPSRRWIRREIATSGHTRYWEGIPGFLREPTFCG